MVCCPSRKLLLRLFQDDPPSTPKDFPITSIYAHIKLTTCNQKLYYHTLLRPGRILIYHDITFNSFPLPLIGLTVKHCMHFLPFFVSLSDELAIATLILTQSHESTFNFGNPYNIENR
ncbi:hypothetical protein TNCV_2760791 [Trichonephila clavipes]|nr:hypothetical protein TNCV_2760791 [Trichonephila clavipes]